MHDSAQSEEGETPQAGSAAGKSKASAAFETCLKIRGLGVDTSGTLTALSNVLCAASGCAGGAAQSEGYEQKTEDGGVSSNESSEAVVLRDVPVEAGDETAEGDGTGTSAAATPGDGRGGGDVQVDRLGPQTGGQNAVDEAASTDASLSPPALWSLEFAYSELERVLEALETAVSGLIFVVGEAARKGAQPEASTLWWVALLAPCFELPRREEPVFIVVCLRLFLFLHCVCVSVEASFSPPCI